MPAWCECLMFGARFLFPLDLRELYFRCTSFGPSRAVAWLKKRQPHAFDPVGALKVDRWLIRRENFLEQAYILMSHHAKRRTMLQVSKADTAPARLSCTGCIRPPTLHAVHAPLQVEFEGPLESGIGSVGISTAASFAPPYSPRSRACTLLSLLMRQASWSRGHKIASCRQSTVYPCACECQNDVWRLHGCNNSMCGIEPQVDQRLGISRQYVHCCPSTSLPPSFFSE